MVGLVGLQCPINKDQVFCGHSNSHTLVRKEAHQLNGGCVSQGVSRPCEAHYLSYTKISEQISDTDFNIRFNALTHRVPRFVHNVAP